jgi:SulP family sulfate permease
MGGNAGTEARRRLPLLQGLLPIRRGRVVPELIAGITLAALAIPEVLGYAKIAGMPAITGLYTILLPMALFAVLGSSRHLVVGADSATAAILTAAVSPIAAPASPRYVQLAGEAALLTGILLLIARLIRIGFLSNFLSRTVLVGFLTGVGIQVAVGQLADMLGVRAQPAGTAGTIADILHAIPRGNVATMLTSLSVITVVLGLRLTDRRIPGALIAVAGAIVASHAVHLATHGVAVLGPVSGGVPHLVIPPLGASDAVLLLPTAGSMFLVILAQSAATSRAYAARYQETFSENVDLVGLGTANIAAACTGSFVVNGSPTKTQMVDSAGGRSQLAQLAASAVVLGAVFSTAALADLPIAALAAVVFLIGIDLIDISGMRRILAVRRAEFVVALLTVAAVVLLGVEQGIVFAIVASIIDHLRHSYAPRNSVLVKSAAGHWKSFPVTAGARTTQGLVIYRFGTSLYFANASRLLTDYALLSRSEPPPSWFCLDCAAIGDVDYSAAEVLQRMHAQLRAQGIRLILSNTLSPVRDQLDHYGITADAYFDTAGEALEAFHTR